MTRWIWIEGRFAWPFVVTILLLALGLVAADFLWRVLTLPFETLAMVYLAAFVVIAGAAVTLSRFARQADRR